jgi:hypothetical protein
MKTNADAERYISQVFIYVYTCICMFTDKRMYTYVCMYVCMYIYRYIYIYINV